MTCSDCYELEITCWSTYEQLCSLWTIIFIIEIQIYNLDEQKFVFASSRELKKKEKKIMFLSSHIWKICNNIKFIVRSQTNVWLAELFSYYMQYCNIIPRPSYQSLTGGFYPKRSVASYQQPPRSLYVSDVGIRRTPTSETYSDLGGFKEASQPPKL